MIVGVLPATGSWKGEAPESERLPLPLNACC